MAAREAPEHYPKNVRVGSQRMDGIVFENGVYEATLDEVIDRETTRIDFPGRNGISDVAEIEFLGPREALDALWSHGTYPCSERLASSTPDNGLKKVFEKSGYTRSGYARPRRELLRVFNPKRGEPPSTRFPYDGKPIIIGAVYPDGLPMVHQVSVVIDSPLHGIREVVLQGHKCQPRSNTPPCTGWERLASSSELRRGRGDSSQEARYLLQVEYPGEYKAYRLKFIPTRRRLGDSTNGKFIDVRRIGFEGCTA